MSFKDKLIKALRSGKYEKCMGRPKTKTKEGECKYCVLGIAADLASIPFEEYTDDGYLISYTITGQRDTTDQFFGMPAESREKIGLSKKGSVLLAKMNDGSKKERPKSLVEIADAIEENPSKYFEANAL